MKYIYFFLNFPLYWVSRIIPKNKDIWLFGCWFGFGYKDNPRYLFEYIRGHHPKIRCVWLTNDINQTKKHAPPDAEIVYSYSPKGYWLSARAYVGVICTSLLDLNRFVFPPKILNTWHGAPLKKIMFDDKHRKSKLNFFYRILYIAFPYLNNNMPFEIICSSEIERNNLSTAFRLDRERVHITGLPRNDVFFESEFKPEKKITSILYMPTHRGEGKGATYSLIAPFLSEIEQFCKKTGMIFYIKLHHYDANQLDIHDYEYIKKINDEDTSGDIYKLLPEVDLLITDYSSVFFDFLLSLKPIIFAAFDLEDYLANDREMYFDYKKTAPGRICTTWNDIFSSIEKINHGEDDFFSARVEAKEKFHQKFSKKTSYCKNSYDLIVRRMLPPSPG